jgi:calcineurin-like phosphoesterase family protein
MANIFVISDTHFDHANILTFKRADGSLLRDFHYVEEMNEHMIERWNSVVRPQDKIYHLGDVTMAKQLPNRIMDRLAGHKRLVRGNHDMGATREYLRYFEEVYACRVLDKMIFTHIPIHPESLGRFKANVHGHVHALPRHHFGPNYFNVSVEAINYTPVSLEDIKKKFV